MIRAAILLALPLQVHAMTIMTGPHRIAPDLYIRTFHNTETGVRGVIYEDESGKRLAMPPLYCGPEVYNPEYGFKEGP